VQRFILRKVFATLGADADSIHIYGEHDAHLINVAGLVVEAVRSHPGKHVLMISDENLDQSWRLRVHDCPVLRRVWQGAR
jgi:hypothetical protein